MNLYHVFRQGRFHIVCSFLFLHFAIYPIATYSYSTGDLKIHEIAGIWRLKSKRSFLPSFHNLKVNYPMKEFTVRPIQPKENDVENRDDSSNEQDILLLLQEDGTFEQRNDNDGGEDIMKGIWDFVDGKLILATERSKDSSNIRKDSHRHDTMLVGKIVATTTATGNNKSPAENDSSSNTIKDTEKLSKTSPSNHDTHVDVHLSVPKGKVKIGKFMYPQKHPSFFENPMFQPISTGSFELLQVLGSLNTKTDDDTDSEEKFRKEDLMNKRYLLTSYPIPTYRNRRQRWSIKYNKFVDAKAKTKDEEEREEREKLEPVQIKSFEVELFANNTFSTITGLGDMTLRGKWYIIGEKRDQLWMQVFRFGFGRSVSGSTFSEGRTLTQKDEVAYWGQIYEVDVVGKDNNIEDNPLDWPGTRIEINGSVMDGWGLEPSSMARFTMIEKTEDDFEDDEDDEYDDLDEDIGTFE